MGFRKERAATGLGPSGLRKKKKKTGLLGRCGCGSDVYDNSLFFFHTSLNGLASF